MEAPLSVLLRNNTHASASVRLALKVAQLTLAYARTPIHIAIPFSEPEIFDLGSTRPTITMSGLVDAVGGDQSNTSSGTDDVSGNTYAFKGMESLTIGSQTYYIPYKNYLEEKLLTWTTKEGQDLQLEIGDATTPQATSGAFSTGGGIYPVAIQQFQFALAPGMEDRYTYSIQCVAKFRDDVAFA